MRDVGCRTEEPGRPGELVRLIVERAEELYAGPLADDVALLLIARRAR